MLSKFGECHVAVNGEEAISAFKDSFTAQYDLVCLDINMPIKNGMEALKEMREFENTIGVASPGFVKIIMTTGLDDKRNILDSFKEQCDGYLIKPIHADKLSELLTSLGLV